MDQALTAVQDNEDETFDYLTKTDGAKAAIDHIKKVAELTRGSPRVTIRRTGMRLRHRGAAFTERRLTISALRSSAISSHPVAADLQMGVARRLLR